MAELLFIYEPEATGHHLSYVRHLLLNSPPGTEFRVCTTAGVHRSEEWAQQLAPLEPAVVLLNGALSGADLRDLTLLGRVVLMSGDRLLPKLAFSPRRSRLQSVTALIMRSPFTRPTTPRDLLVNAVKILTITATRLRGTRIALLQDPFLAPGLLERLLGRMLRIISVPDPVELAEEFRGRSQAKTSLGFEPQHKLCLLIGTITLRKSPELLLRALAMTKNADVRVVFAGTLDPAASALLATPQSQHAIQGGRLVVRPGLLTNDEFADYISAADWVYCVYTTNISSGVALRAAACGKRLLVRHGSNLARASARGVPVIQVRTAEHVALVLESVDDIAEIQLQLPGPVEFSRALLS